MIGLKKSSDFKEVYRCRDSKANDLLIMYKKNNNTSDNRVGISVSKKVGNSVVRHRLKRQMKEIVRFHENKLQHGYDIVFVLRVSSNGVSYHRLELAFWNLVKRHGMISVYEPLVDDI